MDDSILETRIPPLMLVLIVAGLMWLMVIALPTLSVAVPIGMAAGFGLAGTAAALAGVIEFRRSQTTVDPRDPGKTVALVTGGIYRWSRNPMYLGFALWLVSWGFFLQSPIALLLIPVFVGYMNRFQIQAEERVLQKQFGQAYANYCTRVDRWVGRSGYMGW